MMYAENVTDKITYFWNIVLSFFLVCAQISFSTNDSSSRLAKCVETMFFTEVN